MSRRDLAAAVSERLGARRLIWAGIRGDDVEAIADLPHLAAAFSIIGAYNKRSSIEGLAFEDLNDTRVDLETWDIDNYLQTPEAVTFRRAILRALTQPSALLSYRPSRFLSAIWFARRDRCLNLGLFGGHQSAFEHKPWVETCVAALGVPHIPWTYVADDDQLRTRDLLNSGSLVLRRSRTSGGEGFVKVDNPAELVSMWPHEEEAFVSVAPYIDGALPVNVGATVWHDGVTVHFPSVQLIGLPSCIHRPFGYCGNDFGLAAKFDPAVLDRIEQQTVTIGNWLRCFGYLGTYGVDYMVVGNDVLFTEVNPRFQGSTHASSRLSVESEEPCLLLEHIASLLGISAPPRRSLRSLVRDVTPLAHFVVHWTGSEPHHLDPRPLTGPLLQQVETAGVDVVTRPTLVTEKGGVVARATVRDMVTITGHELVQPWLGIVSNWTDPPSASSDQPLRRAQLA